MELGRVWSSLEAFSGSHHFKSNRNEI